VNNDLNSFSVSGADFVLEVRDLGNRNTRGERERDWYFLRSVGILSWTVSSQQLWLSSNVVKSICERGAGRCCTYTGLEMREENIYYQGRARFDLAGFVFLWGRTRPEEQENWLLRTVSGELKTKFSSRWRLATQKDKTTF